MLVASSKIKMSGRSATTPAIATLCFWPPDKRAGSFLENSAIPTNDKASVTRTSISSSGIP